MTAATIAPAKAKYVSIYKVRGLSRLPESVESRELIALKSGLKATLTTNLNQHLLHIDKSLALSSQLLQGLFSTDREGTPEERLAKEIEAIRSERMKKAGSGVFVVFESEEDLSAAPNFDARRDCPDYSIGLDGLNKADLQAKFEAEVSLGQLALSLSLTANTDRRFEKIGSVVYLIDAGTEKPTYFYNLSVGSARASLARPLTDDVVTRVGTIAPALLGVRLARPTRLLVSSLEESADALLAFISAWSALEMFVNVTFKDNYEARWMASTGFKDNYGARWMASRGPDPKMPTLARKFEYIASILDNANSTTDGGEFRRLKRIRDDFFHEVGTPRESLPTDAIQQLLSKYMVLQLSP